MVNKIGDDWVSLKRNDLVDYFYTKYVEIVRRKDPAYEAYTWYQEEGLRRRVLFHTTDNKWLEGDSEVAHDVQPNPPMREVRVRYDDDA